MLAVVPTSLGGPSRKIDRSNSACLCRRRVLLLSRVIFWLVTESTGGEPGDQPDGVPEHQVSENLARVISHSVGQRE